MLSPLIKAIANQYKNQAKYRSEEPQGVGTFATKHSKWLKFLWPARIEQATISFLMGYFGGFLAIAWTREI